MDEAITASAGCSPLRHVRGVLFDVDGVLHVGMRPIRGAAAVLTSLAERGVPFRLLTNTTTASRVTLAARLRDIGLPVETDRLLTAPVATAAYVRRRFPGVPCYLLSKGDAVDDFHQRVEALVEDPQVDPDVGRVRFSKSRR